MAKEEFAEYVRGNLQIGDTITSGDDYGVPAFAKKGSLYDLLEIDATSGGLKVDIVDASGLVIDVDVDMYLDGHTIAATPDETGMVFMGTDGTNLRFVSVDASGYVDVNVKNTVTVDAVNLDIRDLDASQDNIAISDGTDTLAVNTDGSINVVTTMGDETWEYGSTNLVKGGETTVKSYSPASGSKKVTGFIASGQGKCIWKVKFGVTASEAIIATMWTTSSDTTRKFVFPNSIEVESTETILITGENKATSASPVSDFTGYVSLIHEA